MSKEPAKKRPVIKTNLQDDLLPLEQAALAYIRNLKGEPAIQHYEEIPDVRKSFFKRLMKK